MAVEMKITDNQREGYVLEVTEIDKYDDTISISVTRNSYENELLKVEGESIWLTKSDAKALVGYLKTAFDL